MGINVLCIFLVLQIYIFDMNINIMHYNLFHLFEETVFLIFFFFYINGVSYIKQSSYDG